ncbi:hypothetical protein ACH9L7_02305 [Haloferax sp. S1W]|uniref:hypothetical protein n=1 Tax=Haloferax sp. S1W TaxID=3377110 RepID=UPI0037CAF771
MSTITEQPETEMDARLMANIDTSMRVVGATLTIGSLLAIVSLVLHPAPATTLSQQMTIIADAGMRWVGVHLAAAIGFALFAIAGLVVLTAHSRLTQEWWTMFAWGVVTIGALATMTAAVAEATVVADLAAAGNAEAFEAWEVFAEGMVTGFAFLALGIAVIAGNEARTAERATPMWAAWIAVLAGVLAFVGFAMGMWLGIAIGGLVWLVSAIVMTLWTLWFGVALLRLEPVMQTRTEQSPA